MKKAKQPPKKIGWLGAFCNTYCNIYYAHITLVILRGSALLALVIMRGTTKAGARALVMMRGRTKAGFGALVTVRGRRALCDDAC